MLSERHKDSICTGGALAGPPPPAAEPSLSSCAERTVPILQDCPEIHTRYAGVAGETAPG